MGVLPVPCYLENEWCADCLGPLVTEPSFLQRFIPLCCARIEEEVASGSGSNPEATNDADRALTWFQTILYNVVKTAYVLFFSRQTITLRHLTQDGMWTGTGLNSGAAILPHKDALIRILTLTLPLRRKQGFWQTGPANGPRRH